MSSWAVQFNDVPPEPQRLAWCAWLRHHGIDPGEVCVPGGIERDEEHRRIRYLAYVTDERGCYVPNEDGTDALREVRVAQLESVPSPFPDKAFE